MSEPQLVNGRYLNHCTKCHRTREVPPDSPLLKAWQQNFPAYPEALQAVGPDRPWVYAGWDGKHATEAPVKREPPSKFVTTQKEHEEGKEKHQQGKVVQFPKRPKQTAADPEWLEREWYPIQGRYMYHGTDDRALNPILEEGLYPHDYNVPDWYQCSNDHKTRVYGNEQPTHCQQCGEQLHDESFVPGSRSEWANNMLRPRTNHVYLGTLEKARRYATKTNGANGRLLRVDLHKLNPVNFNADEDSFTHSYHDDYPVVQQVWGYDPPPQVDYWDSGDQSLGGWADEVGLGQNDEETHHSMAAHGTMAHHGPIPPQAIEWVDLNGKPIRQPQVQPRPAPVKQINPNQMPLWGEPKAAKTVPITKGLSHRISDLSTPLGFGDMYHVTPRRHREDILRQGLQGQDREELGLQSPHTYTWPQPPGNYMFDNPESARDYAFGIHNKSEQREPDWEDRYEWPEPPEGFEDWPYDKQEEWHDEHEPHERTDDPHGYDIWRVNNRGMPMFPDPESQVTQLGTPEEKVWDLGMLHGVQTGEWKDPWGNEQQLGDWGSEAPRYVTPVGIPPQRLNLHEHVPAWNLTQENHEDSLEDSGEREYPTPWAQVPLTGRPMPGHESRREPSRFFNLCRDQ